MRNIFFYMIFGLVTLGFAIFASAETTIDPNMILEISPSEVKFGEKVFFTITVPQYTKLPREEGSVTYHVDVHNSDNELVDSTLWLAWEPFDYVIWTGHPAYNITKADTFTVIIEKTINLSERTGEIVQIGNFTITNNPLPVKQTLKGILPQDVICNEGLELILHVGSKKTDPICVKETTAERLIIREGWKRPQN